MQYPIMKVVGIFFKLPLFPAFSFLLIAKLTHFLKNVHLSIIDKGGNPE